MAARSMEATRGRMGEHRKGTRESPLSYSPRRRLGLLVVELIAAGCEVLEAGVLAEEGQAHGADRTVTLLADDDFGDALVLGFRVIDLVPVDEHDHVGVLLDGP